MDSNLPRNPPLPPLPRLAEASGVGEPSTPLRTGPPVPTPPLPPKSFVPPEIPSIYPPSSRRNPSDEGGLPSKPAPKKSKKLFAGIAGLVMLIAALSGGLYSVGRQQLFRPQATILPILQPDVAAQCTSLIVQKENVDGIWQITDPATEAHPGDVIRFTIVGSSSSGTFTKAAFFINNGQPIFDTTPADGFFTTYTIPAAGELSAGAVLYHGTEGWVK